MAGKSFSIKTLLQKEFRQVPISEEWRGIIGAVERNFTMIIYGRSGSGKTTFTLRMCKELTKHGKVYFNSAEQGFIKSLQDNVKSSGIMDGLSEEEQDQVERKFIFADNDSYEDMVQRLTTNDARFIVIDSIQYMNLTKTQYKKLKELFPKKAIIMVSHAAGDKPKGEHAKGIEYDVGVKCYVSDGWAYVNSRYGETKPYQIFPSKKRMKLVSMKGTLFEKQVDN